MKKMIALLLAALMICAMFTGCGEKGTTLKNVQKAGKLTIATSPDFPRSNPSATTTRSSALRSTS